mmetsp:Transcript_7716/g.23566  ORF Transcript_7716/g.23566 Transcript_7716/m.23566 type:complete len:211 (+) Transcript_7716:328-960(+)
MLMALRRWREPDLPHAWRHDDLPHTRRLRPDRQTRKAAGRRRLGAAAWVGGAHSARQRIFFLQLPPLLAELVVHRKVAVGRLLPLVTLRHHLLDLHAHSVCLHLGVLQLRLTARRLVEAGGLGALRRATRILQLRLVLPLARSLLHLECRLAFLRFAQHGAEAVALARGGPLLHAQLQLLHLALPVGSLAHGVLQFRLLTARSLPLQLRP